MKSTQIILIIISFIQLANGQVENEAFVKIITTIEYLGQNPDTTFAIVEYGENGKRGEALSVNVRLPVSVDSIQVSEGELIIESIWGDGTKSIFKETKSETELIRFGMDRNGRDTTFFSSFELSQNGKPIKGVIKNFFGFYKYKVNEMFSLDELSMLDLNLRQESDFWDFSGDVDCQGRTKIVISSPEDKRNRMEITVNDDLKPVKIIKRQWHDFHQQVFEDIFYYKYEANRLVEIRNLESDGELVMLKTIEYKRKSTQQK